MKRLVLALLFVIGAVLPISLINSSADASISIKLGFPGYPGYHRRPVYERPYRHCWDHDWRPHRWHDHDRYRDHDYDHEGHHGDWHR